MNFTNFRFSFLNLTLSKDPDESLNEGDPRNIFFFILKNILDSGILGFLPYPICHTILGQT